MLYIATPNVWYQLEDTETMLGTTVGMELQQQCVKTKHFAINQSIIYLCFEWYSCCAKQLFSIMQGRN